MSKTTLSGVERGDYTACITAPHIGHCDIITNGKTHVGKSADGLMSSPEAAKGPLDATLLCHNDIYGGFSCTNGYKSACLHSVCHCSSGSCNAAHPLHEVQSNALCHKY